MREFRLRTDLKRSVVGDYALPLGVEAVDLAPPVQGYTISFTPGTSGDTDPDDVDREGGEGGSTSGFGRFGRDEGRLGRGLGGSLDPELDPELEGELASDEFDDELDPEEPDGYSFHVVVSHDRLRPLLRDALALLPEEVVPIVEIGSRDAYRSVDVYLGEEPIPRERFLEIWQACEPILLEDATIGVGANSEDPWIEVFLDSWKGVTIHVSVDRRDEIERLLRSHGLEEVAETWPDVEENDLSPSTRSREVLELVDDQSPDIDELLLQLRDAWMLELNIDPDTNIDEGGRELGLTLWQALILADSADGDPDRGAYLSIWATASSIGEVQMLVDMVMADHPEWIFNSVYSIDRVAYDERPDSLSALPPRRRQSIVHLVEVDAWGETPPEGERSGDGSGTTHG